MPKNSALELTAEELIRIRDDAQLLIAKRDTIRAYLDGDLELVDAVEAFDEVLDIAQGDAQIENTPQYIVIRVEPSE